MFDFDGLLVDTAHCWHAAYAATMGSDEPLDADLTARLAGASVARAAGILDVPPAVLRTNLRAAFEAARLEPLPGAREVVAHLRGRLPLAVATNGPEDVVGAALHRLELLDSFAVVLSAESQPAEKPAPDVYRAACARLGADPSRSIAFEDSPVGALAARRAGLALVYVSSSGELDDAELQVATLDDPRVLAFLDGA